MFPTRGSASWTPVRFVLPKMPKVILKNGKALSFPYYRQYPVGTSVKMKKFGGEIGMIVRGMIFTPNNPGYNKDGTYDKYRVRVGGDFVYATPNQFMVKRTMPDKHGARGKLGRWLPGHVTKGLRKKEVLAIRHSVARKEIYAKKLKAAHIKKIQKERNTTGRIAEKIHNAEKAKDAESKTQAHCEAMLAKAKRETAFAWKAVKDAQKESVTVEQAKTEVKRIRKELRVTVKAGAKAQYAAEDEAKRLQERLTHETEMFNQFKLSHPPPKKGSSFSSVPRRTL